MANKSPRSEIAIAVHIVLQGQYSQALELRGQAKNKKLELWDMRGHKSK